MESKILQNILVVKDGSVFKAATDFTREVVGESDSAAEVIQLAMDALTGGGEITLGRGDFSLGKPIRLRSNIYLRGSGRATKLRVGKNNDSGVGLMAEDAKGIVISNLALVADDESAKTGLIIDNCGDCKVQNVFCVGFADYGIWLRNNSMLCEISSCSLAGNGKANIYLDEFMRGRYGDFIPNLVSSCTIYGGGKGIALNQAIVVNIVGCMVYQTKGVAFDLYRSNSVVISGSRSFQISDHAVAAKESHELNFTGNIFCWHTGHGIVLENCKWGTISGNDIIDTGSWNSGKKDMTTHPGELPADRTPCNGIDLSDVAGFHIGGNAIFNWEQGTKMKTGIYEDGKCFKNVITGNNINYFSDRDVVSCGKETEVSRNVSYQPGAHTGPPDVEFIQSFQPELIEHFIAEQI